MYEYDFDDIVLDQENFNFSESPNQLDLTGLENVLNPNSQSEYCIFEKIDLIQKLILLKKENSNYVKRIKFLENLLEPKRELNKLNNFAKNEFIKHAKEKEVEIKMKLKLDNDENAVETYYPINTNTKSNKTEKKKLRKNKKY